MVWPVLLHLQLVTRLFVFSVAALPFICLTAWQAETTTNRTQPVSFIILLVVDGGGGGGGDGDGGGDVRVHMSGRLTA